MNDALASIIRTGVPYIVGSVVAWLAEKGVQLDAAQVASATAIVAFGIGTGYYLIVRTLESRYPKLGYLLGVPSQPKYDLK
jgi:uncharacterized membrane protein (DUF441 family)